MSKPIVFRLFIAALRTMDRTRPNSACPNTSEELFMFRPEKLSESFRTSGFLLVTSPLESLRQNLMVNISNGNTIVFVPSMTDIHCMYML